LKKSANTKAVQTEQTAVQSKSSASQSKADAYLRAAHLDDLDRLLEIEEACFTTDRLSRRSFKRHLQSPLCNLIVAEVASDTGQLTILGYGLAFRRRGTRLSRLYSLAILPEARGLGLARKILAQLEALSAARGRHYMRLEVAKNNTAAIKLYEEFGYHSFGEYSDYYEDHGDALRMQKKIRHIESDGVNRVTPWYRQTTEFTCGPSTLMMAMASLQSEFVFSQGLELELWRESTTIYMTSGHGGCHPFGLAMSAQKRGFTAEVWVNKEQPLFLDGVRSEHKKQIMTTVHNSYHEACLAAGVNIHYQEFDQFTLESMLREGCAVLILISVYRLEGKKAPHWLVVTGIDSACLYVHDPDPDKIFDQPLDCQYIPIAREDFARMSAYGSGRLRTAVVLRPKAGRSQKRRKKTV